MHRHVNSKHSRTLHLPSQRDSVQSLIVIFSMLCTLFLLPQPAAAVGEASTLFGVFVPVSMISSRVATLVVTAVSDGTIVSITDKYNDGCQAQNVTNQTLSAGQSYIVPVPSSNALPGGCYFVVQSNKPVVVANETTNTDWQHAFVPADNHRGAGTSFYLYRLQGLQQAFATSNVFDAFAYSDNTEIRITDITSGTGKTTGGKTDVVSDAKGTMVFSAVINAGQDLLEVNQKKAVLVDGHTYHIVSSSDITIQFGALAKLATGSRDGGAYVPGKTGYTTDRVFYFVIPYEVVTERELRIVSYGAPSSVTVRGWNTLTGQFDTIVSNTPLGVYGHMELVGSALKTYSNSTGVFGYYFFEVTATNLISVYECNWMETGSYGTSDTASYISSEEGTGAGKYFETYMGPPALHPYTSTMTSDLIVSAYQTATVTVVDSDNYGEYVELYNGSSQTVNIGNWQIKSSTGIMQIPVTATIKPGSTYLAQYHTLGTGATANYVYGAAYPNFRLDNGADSITLCDANCNNLKDTLVYSDTGWGSHGVYYSLERTDPTLPFTSSNARDSSVANLVSTKNLGDFYGSPGSFNGISHTLVTTGAVVINEVMTGRIYRKVTIPPLGYYDFSLIGSEWEGLHNGWAPGRISDAAHPENPYFLVTSDNPVSVMNTNWDDNWMAYATGMLRPDPSLSLTMDRNRYLPGDPVYITVAGSNTYASLNQPTLKVNIPPGISYTPGNVQSTGILSGTTPTQTLQTNGSWQLTWALTGTMGTGLGNQLGALITGTITSTAPNGALYNAVASLAAVDVTVQNYTSQDTVIADVTYTPTAQTSSILVNEVMNNPGCSGDQWIELYNRSDSNLALSGYELANSKGLVYRFPANLPSLTIGNYLEVHLSNGTDVTVTTSSNPAMKLYAGTAVISALDAKDDQVALFNSSLHTSSSLLDYVRWDISGTLVNRGDLDMAIASGNWLTNSYVLPAAIGASMNRLANGANVSDTNSSTDWVSGTPSPGQINNPTLVAQMPDPITNLSATPLITQEGAIQLSWTNPITNYDSALVIRSPITYPTRLSDGSAVFNHGYPAPSIYVDTGVTQTTPVYYAAFSFRGASVACATASAQTVALAPQRIILAYEDQKGHSLSDWDTNDFITSQDSAVTLNSNGITRIETRFTAMARGAFFDHAMTLTIPLAGDSLVLIQQFTPAGVLAGQQLTTAHGTVSASVFTSTLYALPRPSVPFGSYATNTWPGTKQIDGTSARIVITPVTPLVNTLGSIGVPPFDPWIHVRDTGADIHLILPGNMGNSQTVGSSSSPLFQRDLPLAQNFQHNWQWPIEGAGIWLAYPQYTQFVTSGGTQNSSWFLYPDPTQLWANNKAPLGPANARAQSVNPGAYTATSLPSPRKLKPADMLTGWPQTMVGSIFASPIIVNLDISGTINGKILVDASQSGQTVAWNPDGSERWSHSTGIPIRSSPTAGDMGGDGHVVILIGCGDGKLYAWYGDTGYVVPGFPLSVGAGIKSTPALVKIPEETGLSIVFQDDDGKVHLVNHLGVERAGWPQNTGAVIDTHGGVILNSSPAVGDLDGDGIPEIVIGSTSDRVFAWHLDGTPVSRFWPRSTGDWVYGSPVIVDLNQDGYRDVVVGSGDGYLYAWRGDGAALPGFPVYLGGPIAASPAVFDLNGDGSLEILISTIGGKVYAVHSDGTIASGWPVDMQTTTYSSVAGADINSDGYPEVIVGSYKGLYAFNHDGTLLDGWPIQTGDWIVASPTVGDLNGDHLVDIAIGSYNGKVDVLREPAVLHSTAIAWGNFRRDTAQTGFVALDIPVLQLPTLHNYYLPLVYHQ